MKRAKRKIEPVFFFGVIMLAIMAGLLLLSISPRAEAGADRFRMMYRQDSGGVTVQIWRDMHTDVDYLRIGSGLAVLEKR